jgi:hypothetical protein
MEKGAIKLVVFHGEDFSYWKARTQGYLLSQGHAIWEIVEENYRMPDTLVGATPAEVAKFENNSKARNILITALSRKEFDRVSHLKTAHDVWQKLCNTYEGTSQIKSMRKDTYNRQYQTFSQKSGESLSDCFARFESIVSNLRSCGALAYSENEMAKQLLYSLDESVWGIKIAAIEETADFATLDCDALFSKLKSHELSKQSRPNYDNALPSSSRALMSKSSANDDNACLVANPSHGRNSLEFALSSLVSASDEQMEAIPNEELALLTKKFKRFYNNRKERRGGRTRGCFECGDMNHYIADCPKKKKFDYSNKNDNFKGSYKDDYKKKKSFGSKKKNIKKIMSRACAALSDIDFSNKDISSSDEGRRKSRQRRRTMTSPVFASWQEEAHKRRISTPIPTPM